VNYFLDLLVNSCTDVRHVEAFPTLDGRVLGERRQSSV
jgi:hypothetical protein